MHTTNNDISINITSLVWLISLFPYLSLSGQGSVPSRLSSLPQQLAHPAFYSICPGRGCVFPQKWSTELTMHLCRVPTPRACRRTSLHPYPLCAIVALSKGSGDNFIFTKFCQSLCPYEVHRSQSQHRIAGDFRYKQFSCKQNKPPHKQNRCYYRALTSEQGMKSEIRTPHKILR